ncbi:MAG: bacteriocin [Thermoclostridium sp.]|nr:bacteriocin [Thermoclostridium sp.]
MKKMVDDVTQKEESVLTDEELEQVSGGLERPKPPVAPGSGDGM